MLEDPDPTDAPAHEPPRATLVALAGELMPAAILMGGAHTLHGNDVRLDDVGRAWIVDCAGDMPPEYRERAGRFVTRVFPDLDGQVPALSRLRDLAAEIARESRSPAKDGPERIYLMCQHGLNRSGLLTGLLLRELGLSGAEAVARILAARPGSLSNQSFRAILEADGPSAS